MEQELVQFICNQLDEREAPEYKWKFNIRDRVDWLDQGNYSGNTFHEAATVLDCAAEKFRHSLVENNYQKLFETIRFIMDWGGVYYPQGPRRGNQASIEQFLDTLPALLKIVKDNNDRIRKRNYSEITRMNAGWTKVWAALYPDELVMLDSRVSKAFFSLVRSFLETRGITDRFLDVFPDTYQAVYNNDDNRSVVGFRCVSHQYPHNWARSMMFVSRVLVNVVALANEQNVDIFGGNPHTLRGLEARLFMEGA